MRRIDVQGPPFKQNMKHFLIATFVVTATGIHAQTLDYAWLNQPCGTILNCDSGCTACLLPETQGIVFTGTAAVWHGIDACPYPVSSGDNAVVTYAWPAIADNNHYVSLSGIAFAPVHIDSIIIRHSAAADGPQRLLTRFGINTTMPTTVVSDVPAMETWTETMLTDLGCVAAGDGMIYGYFQILLQAYGGGNGAWAIDHLRIVASPCAATGIDEVFAVQQHTASSTTYDALGKNTGQVAANGLYLNGSKVVVVVQ